MHPPQGMAVAALQAASERPLSMACERAAFHPNICLTDKTGISAGMIFLNVKSRSHKKRKGQNLSAPTLVDADDRQLRF